MVPGKKKVTMNAAVTTAKSGHTPSTTRSNWKLVNVWSEQGADLPLFGTVQFVRHAGG
jgi:hypothetical protein